MAAKSLPAFENFTMEEGRVCPFASHRVQRALGLPSALFALPRAPFLLQAADGGCGSINAAAARQSKQSHGKVSRYPGLNQQIAPRAKTRPGLTLQRSPLGVTSEEPPCPDTPRLSPETLSFGKHLLGSIFSQCVPLENSMAHNDQPQDLLGVEASIHLPLFNTVPAEHTGCTDP